MSRLSAALTSDDLGHYENPCDSDVVRAAGLTAIQKGLGMLILEAKEAAAGESSHAVARIKDLEAALERYVRRWAMRSSMRLKVAPVASMLVRELILDRCLVCQGRGYIPMRYDGQRFVAVVGDADDKTKDVECNACLGSGQGRRDYIGRARAAGFPEYTRQLGQWWEDALTALAEMELSAFRMMQKKLR